MSHVTRTLLSRSKGQLVAGVLNSHHARTGATWRINTNVIACQLAGGGGILCRHAHTLFYYMLPSQLAYLSCDTVYITSSGCQHF